MTVTALSLIIFGILASIAIVFVVYRGRVRGAKTGLCPKCRYDLRGEFDNGCPECGWRRGGDRATGTRSMKHLIWLAIFIGASTLIVITVITPIAMNTSGLVTHVARPIVSERLVFIIDDQERSIRFERYDDVANPFEFHGELIISGSTRVTSRASSINRRVEMSAFIHPWHDVDKILARGADVWFAEAVAYVRQRRPHDDSLMERYSDVAELAAHAPSDLDRNSGIIRRSAHVESPNYGFYIYLVWCLILIVMAILSGYRWLISSGYRFGSRAKTILGK